MRLVSQVGCRPIERGPIPLRGANCQRAQGATSPPKRRSLVRFRALVRGRVKGHLRCSHRRSPSAILGGSTGLCERSPPSSAWTAFRCDSGQLHRGLFMRMTACFARRPTGCDSRQLHSRRIATVAAVLGKDVLPVRLRHAAPDAGPSWGPRALVAPDERVRSSRPALFLARAPSDGQTSGLQPDDACSIHVARSAAASFG